MGRSLVALLSIWCIMTVRRSYLLKYRSRRKGCRVTSDASYSMLSNYWNPLPFLTWNCIQVIHLYFLSLLAYRWCIRDKDQWEYTFTASSVDSVERNAEKDCIKMLTKTTSTWSQWNSWNRASIVHYVIKLVAKNSGEPSGCGKWNLVAYCTIRGFAEIENSRASKSSSWNYRLTVL